MHSLASVLTAKRIILIRINGQIKQWSILSRHSNTRNKTIALHLMSSDLYMFSAMHEGEDEIRKMKTANRNYTSTQSNNKPTE